MAGSNPACTNPWSIALGRQSLYEPVPMAAYSTLRKAPARAASPSAVTSGAPPYWIVTRAAAPSPCCSQPKWRACSRIAPSRIHLLRNRRQHRLGDFGDDVNLRIDEFGDFVTNSSAQDDTDFVRVQLVILFEPLGQICGCGLQRIRERIRDTRSHPEFRVFHARLIHRTANHVDGEGPIHGCFQSVSG